jgi:hypothetical protein
MDLEGSGCDVIEVVFRHLPGKSEEGYGNLSQGRRFPAQDLNRRPPEYEAEELLTPYGV